MKYELRRTNSLCIDYYVISGMFENILYVYINYLNKLKIPHLSILKREAHAVGHLKINRNAAADKTERKMSIGVIVRNYEEEVFATLQALKLYISLTLLQLELRWL